MENSDTYLRANDNIYSTQNIMIIVAIFITIFFLLYKLGEFLYESGETDKEIMAIRDQNEQDKSEIKQKKEYLEYLKTPQRVEKDAKMQMDKVLPGEEVLVLIEEKSPVVPIPKMEEKQVMKPEIPIIEKWRWVFFHE